MESQLIHPAITNLLELHTLSLSLFIQSIKHLAQSNVMLMNIKNTTSSRQNISSLSVSHIKVGSYTPRTSTLSYSLSSKSFRMRKTRLALITPITSRSTLLKRFLSFLENLYELHLKKPKNVGWKNFQQESEKS